MALQVETLKGCKSDGELSGALKSLPQSLPDTYDRIISNLDSKNSHRVLQVLAWVMFAKMSPSLEVVAAVYSIDTKADHLLPSKENFPKNTRDVLTWCAGLFVQAEGPFAGTSVSIAHFSVKDYFVEAGKKYRFGKYDLSEENALEFITDTCMYLLVSPLSVTLNWLLEQAAPNAETICDYAAIHCVPHLKDSDLFRAEGFLSRNIRQLFLSLNDAALKKWSVWYARSVSKLRARQRLPRIPNYFYVHRLASTSGERSLTHTPIFCSPIHVATNFELVDVLRWLLERDRKAGGSLKWFTERMNVDDDATLLQKEIELDVNFRCLDPDHCCEKEIPLFYAYTQDNVALFRVLIKHGANPQVKCDAQSLQRNSYDFVDGFNGESSSSYTSVLQLAAAMGHKDIIRAILDNAGPESDDTCFPGAYPADHHHRNVVRNQLLLTAFATACANADIDTSEFIYSFGDPKFLLDHDTIDPFFIKKAGKGDIQVVKLLFSLTEKAKMSFDDNCFHKAFFEACRALSIDVAEYIYSLGRLDINRVETQSGFLRACRDSVFESLVREMLREGIDVDLELAQEVLSTPLQNACVGKNWEVVTHLLDLGADVIFASAGRGRYGVIQFFCGYYHNVRILSLLLQKVQPGVRSNDERGVRIFFVRISLLTCSR